MAIHLHQLHFTWPDGSPVLDDVTFALSPGHHALIGHNGSGKTTLLRLLAGELVPARGTASCSGRVAYVPQRPQLSGSVSSSLSIDERLNALKRIEAGSVDPDDFDIVGDDWDIADRACTLLARLGLPTIELDRPISTLSGGERTLIAIAAALVGRPDVLLLDEPSNNLDERARAYLFDALSDFSGVLLVASHDAQLLRMVGSIGELRDGSVSWYGGNLDVYEEVLAVEQQAAQRAVRDAQATIRTERRESQENQTKLARRRAVGAKAQREKRVPGIIAGGRKRAAQVSAAKLEKVHQERLDAARQQLSEAEERLRDELTVTVELPATRVAVRKQILTVRDLGLIHVDRTLRFDVMGPERIAVTGHNGSGKTTLFHTIMGQVAPVSGSAEALVPVRLLPQNVEILRDDVSAMDAVRSYAPSAHPQQIRAKLARFGLPSDRALLRAGDLSGGERLRAALACLLLAEPAPQLLLLDEPTNNLDRQAAASLVSALEMYEGALMVVSHDQEFRDRIGITREISLTPPSIR